MIPSEGVKLVVFISVGAVQVGVFYVLRKKLRSIKHALTNMSEADDDAMAPLFLSSAAPKRVEEGSFLFALGGKKQPNRQQRLFWFGAKGPAFILHVVRTTLFFVSVYFALLVFRFGDDLSGTTICLFGVALCFPLVIIWVLAPEVVPLPIWGSAVLPACNHLGA